MQHELASGWGEDAVLRLAPRVDAIVIVDVLSFSTAVDVAVSRGASVIPCRWNDARAAQIARERDAILATPRGEGPFTLSPPSLAALPAGARLVLPSPNGATLSLLTGETPTFAGCLRNASAVAAAAREIGPRVAVVAAGEITPDGSRRLAIEDLIGAGAILDALPGGVSPEARLAIKAFHQAKPHLVEWLEQCESGEELRAWGYPQDVACAAARDASDAAPRLREGAYAG